MASDYSYVHSPPSKSRSAEFYEGRREHRMGVLVTGPWPMSQARRLPDKTPPVTLRNSTFVSSSGNLPARLINRRPLSMPPQASNVLRDPGSVASQDQSDALCQRFPSAIPSRINATLHGVPVSPPTCVPWLRKMKVMKKLRRKIGMGSGEIGISPNNLPPLLFSPVHGDNIEIHLGGTIARRSNSFCKAIAFSNRRVKVNEKICIKFLEVATAWNGVLRFGFTSLDPNTLKSSLPDYVVPDLASRKGVWAQPLQDRFVKQDSILFYYVNQAGDVHFGINGKEMGTYFKDVDTRGPLWAVLDVYGNTTAIEFVDPRAHLNNSRRSLNESTLSRDDVDSTIIPSMDALNLERYQNRRDEEETVRMYHYPQTVPFNITVHRTTGCNVEVAKNRHVAWRNPSEYANGYVFTSRPILLGETLVLKIEQTEAGYASSMGFGLTSCNPDYIRSDSFPDDSNLLLNRPEYWIVKKEAASNPVVGDELAFTVTLSGSVLVSKNGGPALFLMHADTSIPLWAFIDMYGTTQRVMLVGTIPPPHPKGVKMLRTEVEIQHRPRLPLPSQITPSPATNACTELPSSSRSWYQSEGPRTSSPSVSSSPLQLNLPIQKYKNNGRSQTIELELTPLRLKSAKSSNEQNLRIVTEARTSGSRLQLMATPAEGSNYCVECVACCERPVDSVFYSCGHMTFCYKCALEHWKLKETSHCPICRAVITDVIRTYKA